ncbi:MAG: HEAT repeat domain-containing protein [Planctomycetota bacterium]|nr:HEAT repeat domain-containing protein [Planctomycetota bacterium]
MKALITTALIAALSLPALAVDAYAHGGQYRGPGGALPPGLKEPHDPQPPPPPPSEGGPPVTPGTTPTGRPTPPVTDPGGSPVTPPTDPLSGGGRARPTKASITADSWVFWYEVNKDVLEELKRHIYALGGSNNGPFGTSLTEAGARTGARQATRSAVKSEVVPALLWALDPANFSHQDIESAAYLALAKMTDDPTHIELIKKGTASKNLITAESCCLALGLLRREEADDRFSPGLLDNTRDFLFGVIQDDKFHDRARAFAAMAIGLLGDQPTGSNGYEGASYSTQRLFEALERDEAGADVPISLLLAISTQDATSLTEDHRLALRQIAIKRRIGKREVADHVASYAALALGRVGDPQTDAMTLRRLLSSKRTERNTARSAAIGLGTLGSRASPEDRAEIAREIVDSIDAKRIKETTLKNFAAISLAYLVKADVKSDRTGVLGDDKVRRFLLRNADDGHYLTRPYGALTLGLICSAIGDSPTIPVYGEFQADARDVLREGLRTNRLDKHGRGAFAVALGIAADKRSIKDLAALVADESEDDELRGYAAIGLGHIGVGTAQVNEPIRVALVSRRSERLRRAAATALGLLRDREAVPILLDELKSARTQSAKGQTVVALAKVGDERSITTLIELLKSDKEQELTRALACAGLGIVGDVAWVPSLSLISTDINFRASTDAVDEVLSIL